MHKRSNIDWIIRRSKIIEVIVGFANAMDEKNWQKLRDYLANEIEIDYSDFRGEPPQLVTAEEYVKQRVDGLAGLRTLHISTNHEVTIEGNLAYCKSAYCIYRVDPTLEAGQDRLDTAGNYLHQLIRVNQEWRVNAVKQTVVVMSGNPQVHGALRNSSSWH
ncbi:nuclear transport factor 2 family protein [Nostoc sp.]|uniref:nuclear transport factor 2 family protein n=1 Tax=Nostoc sp. TaxID=1180 RepID=UPI002FF5F3E8